MYINRLIGQNRWLDAFGRAGAEWVIVALIAWFVVGFVQVSEFDLWLVSKSLMVLFGFWLFGMIVGYISALFVQEVRPHLKHPESKYLFLPLSNWKAFPSDHAYTAFFFFFIAIIACLPNAWSLLPLALWIGWGRVYAGVHYPFDILGGIILAGIISVIYYFYAIPLITFLELL
ncbi:MAG: phosphatase PAP2 family protein [bacterium]|nr:phosphatase PAP2 family protein [bacterium]